MTKYSIAIGADGAGTTFAAILEACKSKRIAAEVVLLFTNKSTCGAVKKAHGNGVPVVVLEGTAQEREHQLLQALTQDFAPVHLVCLAGYLRLVPENIVQAFRGRILNSHPAVDLARFGGHGMYGARVTQAEIEAGLKESGSTIHIVDERYDHGEIVLQSHTFIPILPNDTGETLLARKMPQERELYIEAIARLLS